jgi:hypothetical protein
MFYFSLAFSSMNVAEGNFLTILFTGGLGCLQSYLAIVFTPQNLQPNNLINKTILCAVYLIVS